MIADVLWVPPTVAVTVAVMGTLDEKFGINSTAASPLLSVCTLEDERVPAVVVKVTAIPVIALPN